MDKAKPSRAKQRRCETEDCDRKHFGNGLCNTHYMQRRRAAKEAANPRAVEPDLPGETWRPIPGYEGSYEASDLGRVRSVERTITDRLGRSRRVRNRVLRPAVCKRGDRITHLSVVLGLGNPHHVHRLIMLAFVGPRPEGLETCHNNGDPTDNRLENLRYDTNSANHLDMQRHGTDVYRNRTHCPRNHLLAEPNLKPSALAKGHRDCLACGRARNMAHYYRRTYGEGVRPYDFEREADRYYEAIMRG